MISLRRFFPQWRLQRIQAGLSARIQDRNRRLLLMAGERPCACRASPIASGVQKPAPRGQSQQFFQIVGMRRPQEAIVGEGDEVEVPVSQILQQGVLLFFPLQWLR
ncbi:MAG: hypothetical protein KKF28_02400 [Proteobacteria bacterium]|nr:hypothetical protein [Pseudomonadota bacterium]